MLRWKEKSMPIRPNWTSSHNYNILLTGVHHHRITLLLSQTAIVKIFKTICKVYHAFDLLSSSFYIQLFTFVYVIAGLYAISNVRYRIMNLMLLIILLILTSIIMNACFVCETLYINVYIQTGNKNTENWEYLCIMDSLFHAFLF